MEDSTAWNAKKSVPALVCAEYHRCFGMEVNRHENAMLQFKMEHSNGADKGISKQADG